MQLGVYFRLIPLITLSAHSTKEPTMTQWHWNTPSMTSSLQATMHQSNYGSSRIAVWCRAGTPSTWSVGSTTTTPARYCLCRPSRTVMGSFWALDQFCRSNVYDSRGCDYWIGQKFKTIFIILTHKRESEQRDIQLVSVCNLATRCHNILLISPLLNILDKSCQLKSWCNLSFLCWLAHMFSQQS